MVNPVKSVSIREQLDAEISNQQGEVDRLMAAVKRDLPAAQKKLDTLKALAGELTPEFEDLAQRLAQIDVPVPVDGKK